MKLRAHTGPTIVKEMAAKLRDAGVKVTIEGTEHVYVEFEGHAKGVTDADFTIRQVLKNKHGSSFGLKFTAY